MISSWFGSQYQLPFDEALYSTSYGRHPSLSFEPIAVVVVSFGTDFDLNVGAFLLLADDRMKKCGD